MFKVSGIRYKTFLLMLMAASQMMADGTWRNYLCYRNIETVEKAGNTLYVLADGALYAYNTADESVDAYDKAGVLSDAGISHIRWCPKAQRLVVVYDNSNIDLMSPSATVVNLRQVSERIMPVSKHINGILVPSSQSQTVWLPTDFGIMAIDVARAEITGTCMLGMKVSDMAATDDSLYAMTDSLGLLACSRRDPFINKNNWRKSQANVEMQSGPTGTSGIDMARLPRPDGPKHNLFYHSLFRDGTLYTCGGFMAAGVDDPERPGTVQLLTDDDTWIIEQDQLDTITGWAYLDLNSITVNPKNPKHVFASGRTGLYEFLDGRFVKVFRQGDGLYELAQLGGGNTSPDYALTQGITFSPEGDLWILQSMALKPLVVMRSDGTWEDHTHELVMRKGTGLANLTSPIIDSRGLLWFVNNNYQRRALFRYDPTARTMQMYDSFATRDGEQITTLYPICVTEDLEGNVWIGSDVGVLMLTREDIETGETVFTAPRIDGGRWLAGVAVNSIAIDHLGRKWIATSGQGVYLLSTDGSQQLRHFTRDNSPLLSDDVNSVAIDTINRRAYFSTSLGLCSWQEETNDNSNKNDNESIHAYPNPAGPDYGGNITVTGLPAGADVRIVSATGTLVAKGKATNGQFVWSGRESDGRRVHSGIYHVLIARHGGRHGEVCRIAIVN